MTKSSGKFMHSFVTRATPTGRDIRIAKNAEGDVRPGNAENYSGSGNVPTHNLLTGMQTRPTN